MAQAYVCMKISVYPPPLSLGRRRSLDEHSRVNNVWRIQTAFSTYSSCSIKQGGSDIEVIICFSTKFEVSADLTAIESYLPFVTVINDLWNSTMLSLTNICVLFWRSQTQFLQKKRCTYRLFRRLNRDTKKPQMKRVSSED